MKTKILLFSLALCIGYGTAWAQTSYGNLQQGNAGTGGGITNSFFGYQAGLNNIGIWNTFIGHQSGFNNNAVGGDYNTAIGANAFYSNTTGYQNTAIGNGALYSNTEGYENTAIGNYALLNNTTGYWNTANGANALRDNTTGGTNTATGVDALRDNTTGANNTATGFGTLFHNTEGNLNTATGYQTLFFNTTGDGNTATGNSALYNNTTGADNTATGFWALYFNTTGEGNTANGDWALLYNATGNNNTAMGHDAGPGQISDGLLNNTTALGYAATPTASNQVRIGNASVTSIGGYAAWSNLSDGRFKKEIEEDIPGLEFITRLRPVSYDLDRAKINSFLGKEQLKDNDSKQTSPQDYPREVGFVAQEVEALLKENSYTRIGIETPQNDSDHYRIRYSEFVVPLVKGMQEQQEMLQEQQRLIEVLQQQNETLQQRIEALESVNTGKSTGSLQSKSTDNTFKGAALTQNIPNPFDKTTTVKAVVPESVQSAKLVIYNLNGLELESYDLNQRGNVSVAISGGRFPSGTYLYTLVADGKVMDTKKMILTK